MMFHPDSFKPLPPAGAVMHGSVEDIAQVIFYPEIRYKGYLVTPCWWDPESSEPIMRCDMMSDQLTKGDGAEAARARQQALLDDGWRHHDPFVYSKHLHIDELEKIEGPPPEGAF